MSSLLWKINERFRSFFLLLFFFFSFAVIEWNWIVIDLLLEQLHQTTVFMASINTYEIHFNYTLLCLFFVCVCVLLLLFSHYRSQSWQSLNLTVSQPVHYRQFHLCFHQPKMFPSEYLNDLISNVKSPFENVAKPYNYRNNNNKKTPRYILIANIAFKSIIKNFGIT